MRERNEGQGGWVGIRGGGETKEAESNERNEKLIGLG